MTTLHRLALILLAVTAGWNVFGLVTMPALDGSWLGHLSRVLAVGCVWMLVLWKVWTRPRAWGRGAGMVMVLMVPLHAYMWYKSVQYFRRMGREMDFVPELLKFLPYEVLFFTTGVVCLVLGLRSPPVVREANERSGTEN